MECLICNNATEKKHLTFGSYDAGPAKISCDYCLICKIVYHTINENNLDFVISNKKLMVLGPSNYINIYNYENFEYKEDQLFCYGSLDPGQCLYKLEANDNFFEVALKLESNLEFT